MRDYGVHLDLDDLLARYERGQSVLSMSKDLGVSRMAITKRIAGLGLKVRNGTEANLIRMAKLSKEERLALAEAAHAAVRGKSHSFAQLCNRAASRERSCRIASKYEAMMIEWLTEAGIEVVPQKAIGPYNVDIALPESAIAVEIFGGNWHTTGLHAARYRKRIEYLLGCGWLPVVVWASGRCGFHRDCAQQVITIHEINCSNKSARTQEHVIRGDCKTTPVAKVNPDNGPLVLNVKNGNKRRATNGRFC
jgi:very-short-patch-repair endonuclease